MSLPDSMWWSVLTKGSSVTHVCHSDLVSTWGISVCCGKLAAGHPRSSCVYRRCAHYRSQWEHAHGSTRRGIEKDGTGLHLSKDKCWFMAPSFEYLGYKIDAHGLHPLPEKVWAIKKAPKPKNTTELKAYLGLLMYYGRFLPNLSTVLSPLYRLLRQDVCWRWTSKQTSAFAKSKQLLTSAKMLVHYDPKLYLVVAGDASAYGIGVVLSHKMSNGEERPVAFASRILSPACGTQLLSSGERSFGMCLRCQEVSLIYFRPTVHITHRPQANTNPLWREQAYTPQASARMQRWALTLDMYNYKIAFKPTAAHSNAYGLSRLPLPEAHSEVLREIGGRSKSESAVYPYGLSRQTPRSSVGTCLGPNQLRRSVRICV